MRYRDFSLLWVILITSGIGSWLRILGTAQWLLDATESAWLVGVIGLVQLVVQTPALLFGGTFADQLDRKWIMTLSHSVTALVLVGLAALHVADLLTPGWVFAGIAFTAMSHVFASPARSALVPVVVPQHLLLPAASIDTASMNAGAIIGPLVFAAVATTFGLDAVLALGGGLFVLAAVSVWRGKQAWGAGAIVAGLMLFSPSLWLYATHAEVFSLNNSLNIPIKLQ